LNLQPVQLQKQSPGTWQPITEVRVFLLTGGTSSRSYRPDSEYARKTGT